MSWHDQFIIELKSNRPFNVERNEPNKLVQDRFSFIKVIGSVKVDVAI